MRLNLDTNKILVTGGSGMLGHAVQTVLPSAVYLSSADGDLKQWEETVRLFEQHKPDIVINLAGRIGGVKANMQNMGNFYYDNMQINTNVIEACRIFGVNKLLSTLSTCIYPDKAPHPLKESDIHSGPPHSSNYAYAYSKRMVDVQSRAYRKQYGCNFTTVVLNNLFGENDNFDLEESHIIPAIIRKVWEAKINNKPFIECWGDGSPLREFTYSKDTARILLFLLEKYDKEHPINIGNTNEYHIKEVVETICSILEYDGVIKWDTTKPSGQYRKPSTNQKLLDLGWQNEWYTSLEKGLTKTCEWVKLNYPNIRGVS
jgi:GDP-L-fucose synthase|tara:strand:- start:1673 stop:2620 length:948 start_codon:yes stop_codon:yes gene_type:complete